MDSGMVEQLTIEALQVTCRRLTSDLERCHHESVRLVEILLDVAACVGCKRDSNYDTIKQLKGWSKAQVQGRKLDSMQQTTNKETTR